MGRGAFWFEDEEFLQQKREWWICYGDKGGGDGGKGGYSTGAQHDAFGRARGRTGPQGNLAGVDVGPGARDAARETPSALAGIMGYGIDARQANFNANAAREARDMAANRGGGGDFQEQRAAAAAAAEQAKPLPVEPLIDPLGPPPAAAAETRPAPRAAPRPAPQPAFDPAAYMADIQARYDEQLQAIQQEIRAADEARAEQLAELTRQTDERKKKIKSPRKYGRLSLLSGSELGIPTTTTLGG
jgi:hypothetical protein